LFSTCYAGSVLDTRTYKSSSRGSPCFCPSPGSAMISWSRNSRLRPPPPLTLQQPSTVATQRGGPSGHLLLPLGGAPRTSVPPPSSGATCSTTSFGGGHRSRQGGRDRGGGPGGPSVARGDDSWSSFYNPWIGSIFMCLGPFAGTPSSCSAAPQPTFYAAPPELALPAHPTPPQH
jgi:hypothetical protein